MRLKVQHGRVGQPQEYWEWTIVHPRVVVQRVGERWFLGVMHLDGTYQIPLYLDDEADAKLQGRRLAQRYASAEHDTVEEDVKMAAAFVAELVAARQDESLSAARGGAAEGQSALLRGVPRTSTRRRRHRRVHGN